MVRQRSRLPARQNTVFDKRFDAFWKASDTDISVVLVAIPPELILAQEVRFGAIDCQFNS